MRVRLAERISAPQMLELSVSTFHAFGLALLRDHLPRLGFRPGFSLYDAEDIQALLSKLLRASPAGHLAPVAAIQKYIARWKRALIEPHETPVADSEAAEIAAQIYPAYEHRLRIANAMDTDDLLLKPVRLLQQASLLGITPPSLRQVLVDDYDETTIAQHELVRLLTVHGAVLTAVADEQQSILHERGAQADNVQRLASDIAGLRTLRLEQNFRSSRRLVNAANALRPPTCATPSKPLWSDADAGPRFRVLPARTDDHEAERAIADLLAHKSRHSTDFRQYAMLMRNASQAPAIARALRERRVPFNFCGDTALFDKPEVRDVLCYLRLLCNPADDHAFLRVINTPRRDIDGATLSALARYAADRELSLLAAARDPAFAAAIDGERLVALRHFTDWLEAMVPRAHDGDPIRLVCDVLTHLRYEAWLRDTCNDIKIAEQRMRNVSQLIAWLQRLSRQQAGGSLSSVIARLGLLRLQGPLGEDLNADAVALLTIEAAKGREFDFVYLMGMEQGTFPRPTVDVAQQLQEQRLAYVAVSRARHALTFTLAERRRQNGGVITPPPSGFLADLSPTDLDWQPQTATDAVAAGAPPAFVHDLQVFAGDKAAV